MKTVEPHVEPQEIAYLIQQYLDTQLAGVVSNNDWSWCEQHFTWCGELLDYLIEGLESHTRTLGFGFQDPFPGPFRLWDEDQFPNGDHVRRFWTTALHNSSKCPLAIIHTTFHHRHDRIALPHPIQVQGLDPTTGRNKD